MKYKVYIDGQVGTTGLQLRQRLAHHPQIELLLITEALRKDANERKRLMNLADVVFLCLPDAAAKDALTLIENPNTCVIDASTAHRTATGWTYGFPELSSAHREAIKHSKRIANPGCHATGFISLAYPLIGLGILDEDYPFSITSITGYSGGGKEMINEYEHTENRTDAFNSPRQYGLTQQHKHLPEMQHVTGIHAVPVFCPIVADFYSGMATTIPLHARLFKRAVTKAELFALLSDYYKDAPLINVKQLDQGLLPANLHQKTDGLTIYLEGNDDQMTITSVFDNLGKGASGAAVQNMNIVLGLPECESLTIE